MISERGFCDLVRRQPIRVAMFARIILSATIGILVQAAVSSTEAAAWQTEPFLKSIQGGFFDFDYLGKGLRSINSVNFKPDTVNQYQSFFNRMVLTASMGDGANRIRIFKNLSPIDFGILAHEGFHAFKANLLDAKPEYASSKEWLEIRSRIIFDGLPEGKGAVALEEAYASFIGSMVTSKVQLSKMILRPTEKNCIDRVSFLQRMWAADWNAEVKGYYYRDGIGEYWVDQGKALWVLASEGRKAYAELLNSDGAIFVDQSLPKLDKDWIAENIFEGKIRVEFKDTFKDELKEVGCYDEIR
jgi:hypothetical protein